MLLALKPHFYRQKGVSYMDDEMVIQKGVELLMNGLGPLEAIRFLNLPREKRLDSVKQHREWQAHLNRTFLDDVLGG
jgi:hypothetical protein